MSLILFLKTTSVEKKKIFSREWWGLYTYYYYTHNIVCVLWSWESNWKKTHKKPPKVQVITWPSFLWGMAAGAATKCNKKCPICCRWRHHQASSIQEAPARGLFTGLVYRKSYKLMFRNSEHSNKVIDSDIRSQKEGPSTLKKEILVV